MPKGSAELTNSRREEIITACRKLFQSMSYKEITIKEIAEELNISINTVKNAKAKAIDELRNHANTSPLLLLL